MGLDELTGKAFLGIRIKCANCHHHKYDPITHEEYYKFRAFFQPTQSVTTVCRANWVIWICLSGGPPQVDTVDSKPDATACRFYQSDRAKGGLFVEAAWIWPAYSGSAPTPPVGEHADGGVTSVIHLELVGVPTQMDSFDHKPNIRAQFRGPIGVVETNMPGVVFCELMTERARCWTA